ncbi:MAG: hypothetical protein OSB25_06095 [Salibacteraceae bacterium]|nr:hypothetical protein [Salibacteraceae bacterium]|tara:strand:- start:31360 stop:31992 length:633 start_codon:yes stop_codon:yes gene_type:complete
MTQKISSILLLLLLSIGGFTQINQTFLMIGGQELIGVQLDQSPEEIVVETTKKNGKIKIILVDKSSVFSITQNDEETIWYNPDSNEMGYSVKEMRLYLKGQQDGRLEHKTTIPLIASFTVSGLLAALVGSQELAIVILTPIPGALIGSLTKGNMPANAKANGGEPMNQAAYISGYKKSARMKKILHCILGSVAGTAVGGVIGLTIAASDS